ncbi:MAG: aminotransferase class I/II-fold pyridoxal phosphate-dependent enzyme [Terriglobia bacterium]
MTISRYGPRVLPNTEQIIAECKAQDGLIHGPSIARFEEAFSNRFGGLSAIATSYGRMAFLYILKAFGFPPNSEIIFPALTFWIVPEMARVAGFTPVFADVDPRTFNLDPGAFERAITSRTVAVVPTHLYGLACDLDPILAIARRRNLAVIEDCAHALGATYRKQPVGSFGEASFFSFQTLKPLNTYGGGMAVVRNAALAQRVADLAAAEPEAQPKEILKKLLQGRIQRIFTRPSVFTFSAFPILYAASHLNARPDVYLWEKIRHLKALPLSYTQRYTNVQAALGLAGLNFLDEWNQRTRAHAQLMNQMLVDLPGVTPPQAPPDREHIYYQYCTYVPDRDDLVRRCTQRGVDIETLHVDVCTQLPQFGPVSRAMGAERAATAVQLPIYQSLSDDQVRLVARRVRTAVADLARQAPAIA